MAGRSVEELAGLAAVEAMAAFYETARATGADLDADGDMLLFQWGVHDFGGGATFRYDVTRQLIEDDDIWQLSLTCHYDATDEARALGAGSRWCARPASLPDFLDDVGSSPATAYVASVRPLRTELRWEQV